MKQFLRFCIVGTIGFLVDAGTLYLLVLALDTDPYVGRVASFITAATTTWILNRRFTFNLAHNATHKEWLSYLSLMVLGAILNYGTYALCLTYWAVVREQLWIGVAVGSIAALSINFITSRLLFQRVN